MEHRVMLVERNRLMLEKLSNVIRHTEGMELVVRYQDISDALGQGIVFHADLILLDVEGVNALETLGSFKKAYPTTAIVCLGERWEAEAAARLTQNGALGYLIKPFSSDELTSALDTFSKSAIEGTSQTIAFFSPKGKSGKTTLIANLAVALARKTKAEVGVIDADLQFSDMAVLFNVEPQQTIVEAVRDADFLSPIALKNYFLPVQDNVFLLAGTKNPSLSDKIEIRPFEEIVRMAQSLFRYVLIDIPPSFCPISISAAELSTVTYIIAMENQGYEVMHTLRALDIFQDWEDYKERVRILFTRVAPYNEEARQELERLLQYPIDAITPNEYIAVSKAADEGRSVLDSSPNVPYSQCILRIAEHIVSPETRTAAVI